MAEEKPPRNVVVIRAFFDWFRTHRFKAFGFLLLILLIISLVFVPYKVDIQQDGVIQRFGRYIGKVDPPGLHFKFPWRIDRLTRVNARRVYTMELSTREYQKIRVGGEFFTGDENLIEAFCTLQFQIGQSARFLFQVEYPMAVLAMSLKETLIAEIGKRSLDEILASNKEVIQNEILNSLKAEGLVKATGIDLIALNLEKLLPPPETMNSFKEVIAAMENKQQMLNVAESNKLRLVAEAAGVGSRIIELARANAQTTINQALGIAQRFELLVVQNKAFPTGTQITEYYRTLNKLLAETQIYVLRPQQGAFVEVNLLDQILPGLSNLQKQKKEKAASLVPSRSLDRQPGWGTHQDKGMDLHRELPTSTISIPVSEIKETPNE